MIPLIVARHDVFSRRRSGRSLGRPARMLGPWAMTRRTRPNPRSTQGGVSVEHETNTVSSGPLANWPRKLLLGVLLAVVLIAAGVFGTHRLALDAVSTDDTHVDGHVTFAAPAAAGRFPAFWSMTIAAYTKATFLPKSTKSPLEIAVSLKKVAGEFAGGHARVRGNAISSAGTWPVLRNAAEDLQNQTALLRGRVCWFP
jgi:hypothetical protein